MPLFGVIALAGSPGRLWSDPWGCPQGRRSGRGERWSGRHDQGQHQRDGSEDVGQSKGHALEFDVVPGGSCLSRESGPYHPGMRGLLYQGPGDIRFHGSLADPAITAADQVIVAVEAAGLCGSDLHSYLGREAARAGVVPGHEAVGHVVTTGADVRRFTPGDRVIIPFSLSCGECPPCRAGLSSRCVHSALLGWGSPEPGGPVLNGCQAELVCVPMADGSLVAVGEDVAVSDALLLSDNLPTGWYAAARAGVSPGSSVAVIGLGSVGLCAVVACLGMGAGQVIGIDPVAGRRDLALRLGATEVASPEEVEDGLPDDEHGGPDSRRPPVGNGSSGAAKWRRTAQGARQVDAAIEAAGPVAAQKLAAALVRPGGTVSIIAVQTATAFGIPPTMAYDKNLRIAAGRAPVRSLLDQILPLLDVGRLSLPGTAILTHPEVGLSDGPELYRRFADREDGLVKAWFDPSR